MKREPEPELMDLPDEVEAYARADFSQVNQAFVDRLLELAPQPRAKAVDLGTGPGEIPIRLAIARPRWRITALDASAPMLEVARRAAKGRGIRFVLGDAKSSPLPSGAFDVVFSNSLLHHVASPARFWAGVKRIAKPGAVVFVRDLFRPASKRAARAIVEKHAGDESPLLQEEFYRSLLSAYTIGEVRSQLKTAGLDLSARKITDRHLEVS